MSNVNIIQEGTRVEGHYHGVHFTGRVIDWRSKYGGNISYHVSLDHTIYLDIAPSDGRNELTIDVNPSLSSCDYHGIREVGDD